MPRGGVLVAWAPTVLPWLSVVAVAAIFSFSAVASSLTIPYMAWDSHAYWTALTSSDPYAGARVGVIGSFLYPPPFLQLLAPLGRLPWPVFAFGWTAMLAAAAISLLRRVPRKYDGLLPLLTYLAAADIWAGNINILLAHAVVIGLERPAAWPVVALSKVTPGIGVLWHLFRREWHAVVVACGLTAGLALVSLAIGPQLWGDWVALLMSEMPADGYAKSVPIPLVVRLPLAVVVLWWGARTGRPAAVPLACLLALPVIWFNGLALLVGCAALLEVRVRPVR
jgi:hypothetical protein